MRLFMLAALLAVSGVVAGAAAPGRPAGVRFSHGCYHRAVCVRPVAPGTVRCHARIVTTPEGRAVMNAMTAQATPAGYGPSDLRAAYGITGSGSASTIVAVVDAYGYPNAETDLGVYRAQFGLPPCTTANGCFHKVNQSGARASYPREQHRLGAGDRARPRHGQRHVPELQDPAGRGELHRSRRPGGGGEHGGRLGAHAISNSYGGGEAGTQRLRVRLQPPRRRDHGQLRRQRLCGGRVPGVLAARDRRRRHQPQPRQQRPRLDRDRLGRAAAAAAARSTPSRPGRSTRSARCGRRPTSRPSPTRTPAWRSTGPATAGGSGWEVFGGTSVAAPLIARHLWRERRLGPATAATSTARERAERRDHGHQRHLRRHLLLHRP